MLRLSRGASQRLFKISLRRPFASLNIMSEPGDIEDLHQAALRQFSTTYIDPTTGFTVFTEIAHLQRGQCCGNQCRHCPYGWQNVRNSSRSSSSSRTPIVQSGDKKAIAQRLQTLKQQASQQQQQRPATRSLTSTKAESKTGGRHGGRLTQKNVPYTRGGDKGTSQLLTGERRKKDDMAFEAMGTVDELCSLVGVTHSLLLQQQQDDSLGDLPEWLLEIMSRLFDIGSHVAKPRKQNDNDEDEVVFVADGVGGGFDVAHIEELEDWIDVLTEDLPELRSFILPTGHVVAAQLHNCRCVCRRAERRVVPLGQQKVCDPNALKYLNRLSDFFFTAARWVNDRTGQAEIQYRKPSRGSKQRNRVSVNSSEQPDSTDTK